MQLAPPDPAHTCRLADHSAKIVVSWQIRVDYGVGVDTHRNEHVLAVIVASTGAVVAQRSVAATSHGYG